MSSLRSRLIDLPGFNLAARLKVGWEVMSLTTEPARFLRGQLTRQTEPTLYTLRRDQSLKVAVRHGSVDLYTMKQLMILEPHAIPAAVTERLGKLDHPPRVLDLGGNIGLWSAWAASTWPGADVTAVEPDPVNLVVLRAAANVNGWSVVPSAAGVAPGSLRFHATHDGVSRAAGDDMAGPDVIDVEMVDVFELMSEKDIIKVDIEGGEWPILADRRLASINPAAMLVEYHGHMAPATDTHATVVALLEAAGFEVERLPNIPGAPPDEGVIWAWRSVAVDEAHPDEVAGPAVPL